MGKLARSQLFIATLICLPAVMLAVLIYLFGVDVAYWDQWHPLAVTVTARKGVFDIRYLWAQANDTRPFFPYLLFIAIDILAQGNLKWEMYAILLAAVLVLWNIYRLALITVPPGWGRSLAIILASLLIFSPVQWQNWLWGIQLICFMPIACLTSAMLVCYSKLSPWRKLVISAALSVVATYSYANGMICWGLLPVLVLMQFPTVLQRVKAAAVWVTIAALTLLLFFHGYRWLPNTAPLRDLPKFPFKAVLCFLAFLGAPLGLGRGLQDAIVSMSVGLLLLALMGLVAYGLFRRRNDTDILSRSAGWLTIAAYSLGSAAVTTVGRGRDTGYFLLDSRYTTFSLYATVGLLFLLPIVFRRATLWIALGLTVLFLVLDARTSFYAVRVMQQLRDERLQAKACQAFLKVVQSDCQPKLLDWQLVDVIQATWAIAAVGWAHPPIVESSDPKSLAVAGVDPKQYGAFEALSKVTPRFYRASGWAVLPQRGEPADAVLLSYEKPDGKQKLFSIADRTGGRASGGAGWEQWLEVPPGATSLRAWAYDALSGALYPLQGLKLVQDAPLEPIYFRPGGSGSLDQLDAADNTVEVGGWAIPKKADTPTSRVLVTCGPNDPLVGTDAPQRFQEARITPHWHLSIVRSRLPAQGCELKAWEWSGQTHEAALLTPTRVLPATSAKAAPPFGSFDTPVDGAKVDDAVGCTGWALAAASLARVDLWREPNPGERAQQNGLIYIGTATFKEGARPDVEQLHPSYPDASSAGWGYRLQAREFPASGRYRLHAIAHDLAGNSSDLGVKTITIEKRR